MVRKRKIIVYIATSADGFIARPDGSVDWLDRPHPKGNYGMGAFYKSIDAILWGRKTCDMALDFQKKLPKFIGEGMPLIAPGSRTVPLKLISCTKFADGVVKLHYAVCK
jgi:dihydrofolate reductase